MKNQKMSYIKLGILSAVIFTIIIVLVEFLFALNTKQTVDQILEYMLTSKYIISKLIVAIIYGLLMIFLFKRKEKKLGRR